MAELYDAKGQLLNLEQIRIAMAEKNLTALPLRAEFVHDFVSQWRGFWDSKEQKKNLRYMILWKNPKDIGAKDEKAE